MPNAGNAIGTAAGGALGGGVGAAAGNWLGGRIGGLFSHQASSTTLGRTYDNMSGWVKSLVSYDEFAALESNRQAGFFATDVAPTIERLEKISGQDSIESYRAWVNGHYKPNVQALANRLLDARAVVLTQQATPPTSAAGQAGTAAAAGLYPSAPMSPQQAGFFSDKKTLVIAGLVVAFIVILMIFKRR